MNTPLLPNYTPLKNQLLLLLIALALFSTNSFGQCTNCTSTLSGTSLLPNGKIVEAGEVFCINSGGHLKRGLVIKNGGTVCNNGTISSHIDIKEGGSLINNGTIDSEFIYHRGGTFINNGFIESQDMFVDDANFNNYNLVNIYKITIQINDTINAFNNAGVLSSTIFQSIQTQHYDSVYLRYDIINSGEMYVSEKLQNSSRVDFENSGKLFIGDAFYVQDSSYYYFNANFQHSTHATFKNTGQMEVAGNFMNYGDFYTECMIPVGGNMTSSGSITGPLANSCGGFNIAGHSYFVGYLGADYSYIDICDAGSPNGGFDQQATEEIGPHVTFCSCNNDCGPIEVFEDFEGTNHYSLYPNPLSETSVLKFYNPVASFHTLVIYDMYGRVAKTQQGVFGDQITINKEGLKRGIYFFKIASTYNIKATGKLMVN